MEEIYVPALDGIPGIVPGIVRVPSPPEFEKEEIESVQYSQDRKNHHPRNLNNIPRHQRRTMACDKQEK